MPPALQFVNRPPQRLGYPMAMQRRRLRSLGALTAQQAAAVGMPTSTISNTAGFTQAVFNTIVSDVQAGQIQHYTGADAPGDCAKAGNPASITGALTATGSAIALKLVAAGAVAGPAAPLVIAAGVILGIFSAVFNHHALAVAKEQGTLCAAVPAFNTSIQTVVSAVQSNTITPAVGAATLQQVLQDFISTVTPVMKNNASQCDAACVMVKDATAIVASFVSQFQDLANSQATSAANPAASASNIVSSTAASLGVPAWALLAGAGALLYLFL
jgi:hypothetical protein